MPLSMDSRRNRLLAALPEYERQRWLPQLEAVDLTLGQVLHESGCPPTHAYFPTSALVSLLYVTAEGACAEIAVVGNEGIVGAALFMGGVTTPGRAVVQSAGGAWRMKAQCLTDAFEHCAPVRQLLLRFVQALMAQMAQTAVCNRHHSLDQRLCRRLLLSLDRLPGSELVTTQQSIANLLGVRREGVTEAALKLESAGLIRHSRGCIEVLDRAGLERRSCECYAVVRKEYQRLLPAAAATPPVRPHRAVAAEVFEELVGAA
ncbi:MAG: Crp/Fnr family transcriptional regulator [Rubrivivax sp.]|nr:Crp/Fnr family transcriptional regulator [Rubrivivax sp.]